MVNDMQHLFGYLFILNIVTIGARGGYRTPTPLREADFESAASAIPPHGPLHKPSILHRCPPMAAAAS